MPEPVSPADTIRAAFEHCWFQRNTNGLGEVGPDHHEAVAALDALLAERERDRRKIAQLTEALEQIAGIDLVKYVGAPLLEVQRIARAALAAVLADKEDATSSEPVTDATKNDLGRKSAQVGTDSDSSVRAAGEGDT